ncbi:MAG: DUF695 domain-containing protein [Chitinophagaceae bacterium]
MSFLKKIFSGKEEPVRSYADFWAWFKKEEKGFHRVIKTGGDVEQKFFSRLTPKLDELREGFYYVTGMCDADTAELIFTAEGNTSNIAFVEELVAAAPHIAGWKFGAHKPALDIKDVSIEMEGLAFAEDKLSFYSIDTPGYPDEINITVVYEDFTEDRKVTATNGVFLFLDNYLGELDFVNTIDNLNVIGKAEATQPLIPIAKLRDFLIWRQKEFVEKYEGERYDTENDGHSVLEAQLENGDPLLAVINTELLNWDQKASHPWVAVFTARYDGSSNKGLPETDDYNRLDELEQQLLAELRDKDGYLYIGRQTASNEREIYFACKDFRLPSKVFYAIQQQYAPFFETEYVIYKDKYWKSFERFMDNG